jgi:enoyl-CoA hydratase
MTTGTRERGSKLSYENITSETDGSVIVITINRPNVLNNLNESTILELESVLNECNDGLSGAIIITGAGEKSFMAGADISAMSAMGVEEAQEFSRLGHRVTSLIEEHPKPVIAAINGYAFGGGLELALACDIRIASDTAKMGQPEVNLGIIPGWGATQRLVRLAGAGRAKEMIFTGNSIDAAEALQMGIVNKVVPLAELMQTARDLAGKLAAKPAVAISMAKKAVTKAEELSGPEGMALEEECFGRCFSTQDQKEGMASFLEKRQPRFQGK